MNTRYQKYVVMEDTSHVHHKSYAFHTRAKQESKSTSQPYKVVGYDIYWLCQLHGIICRFTIKQFVLLLVLWRVDYCNTVFTRLLTMTLDPLWQVLNAAICLVTGLGPRDHVTEEIKKFHLLPIRYRYQFQVVSDDARCCDWSVPTIHSWHRPSWHYLGGICFKLLQLASLTSPGQELFLGKELSPWLVHVSRTIFHKTLQTAKREVFKQACREVVDFSYLHFIC